MTRVSRALEVAENTVYRWMSGASRPRPVHLKELPDVLPEHRQTLIQAINETFPGTISEATEDVPELPGDVYRRIHYLAATIQDADQCFFTIARELFEQVLQLLGKPQQGMALTYARLMPPRPDAKVHSLYEIFVRGTYPWENEAEGKVFLGRTTLAGNAALTLRTQTWDSSQEQRQPVEVDEHEKSACAAPVMWRGKIAGVIIVSSNRTGMFNNPKMRLLVEEIARLLAIGLSEHDFYAPEQIQLRPMPPLRVQREKVAALYVERALAYARNFKVSGKDAERRVQEELEKEFELMVQ
uniref:GAF domain-containing protein n=1 Tax=Thermosporothrix sp. COM3 TaxID=2490863 RepID=A0A455SWB0_9CHLR|nr:hypothetical protein KTC_41650 [Thermosporothrix sp. COM3]